MGAKLHVHKVEITSGRGQVKKTNATKKGASKQSIQETFESFYKGPVRSLYRTVCKGNRS